MLVVLFRLFTPAGQLRFLPLRAGFFPVRCVAGKRWLERVQMTLAVVVGLRVLKDVAIYVGNQQCPRYFCDHGA